MKGLIFKSGFAAYFLLVAISSWENCIGLTVALLAVPLVSSMVYMARMAIPDSGKPGDGKDRPGGSGSAQGATHP